MHDYRSYQDNLSLASVYYSHAMRSMGCTPDQGLGYCVDEIEPEKPRGQLASFSTPPFFVSAFGLASPRYLTGILLAPSFVMK
ncbi:hypothetical protein ASE35_05705 [Lysobacter sp. Root916]|nr:hypothetical protein ASE35_05705 [Lysobacter sp. Root916]